MGIYSYETTGGIACPVEHRLSRDMPGQILKIDRLLDLPH